MHCLRCCSTSDTEWTHISNIESTQKLFYVGAMFWGVTNATDNTALMKAMQKSSISAIQGTPCGTTPSPACMSQVGKLVVLAVTVV